MAMSFAEADPYYATNGQAMVHMVVQHWAIPMHTLTLGMLISLPMDMLLLLQ